VTRSGATIDGLRRIEGRDKVTGAARYAYEHPVDGAAVAIAVTSTIAKGAVHGIDATTALGHPGVLHVLTHENAPRVAEEADADAELAVLQSPAVAYHGQVVALVVAETLDAAREGGRLLAIEYREQAPDVELNDAHPGLYKPDTVNAGFPTDEGTGNPERELERADVVVDAVYTTPNDQNQPMEPHATIASWSEDGHLTLWDSTQGAPMAVRTIAKILGVDAERVRIISPHVGGGFGSKGLPRPNAILAAIAAQAVGRAVKLALTRQQLFTMVGYRTPTIQRIRLGADVDGRLTALVHEAYEQSSTIKEFAEQTTTCSRVMYASPTRRTSHRLVRLDVPTPSWKRAPGEAPGMFALESAMDELAIAAGIDPVALRILNDPDVEPESGRPFSSRNLVACLREGAERFGWEGRDPTPGVRREGRFLIGTGVAASTYPTRRQPSQATARANDDGTYLIRIGAADIGTGARTALTRIAATALDVDPARVVVEIGDSALPFAMLAGGSMGTASWGSAIVKACRLLLEQGGGEVHADTTEEVQADSDLAKHGFGAQFAQVRVDVDTAETRVDRMLGVFAVGHVIEPRLARSQLIGGMVMGMGMALMEEGLVDARSGALLNHDLAGYHVPVNADVTDVDAIWIDEDDRELNPMGAKGIGEIGITGAPAAIANAVYHATGTRVRDLPIRLDRLLDA
jgi:xanthine dehydrogenase YagR molybdenum-binding subunit